MCTTGSSRARSNGSILAGYRSSCSIASSLVIHPIRRLWQRGTEANICRTQAWANWSAASADRARAAIGSMRARRKIESGYRLKGAKMWITNSPIADVFVVWAVRRARRGDSPSFVLEEEGMKGSVGTER